MYLFRVSVLLVVLCQSAEVGKGGGESPDADFNSAKRGFLQYPMLKDAVCVLPSPALQKATRALPYDDPDSFFKALAHKTFTDTRVLELHPCDLNADGLEDMLVLAARSPIRSEEPTSRAVPIQYRRVMLFLRLENGDYTFAASSDTIVGSSVSDPEERNDPFRSIRVSQGRMVFEYSYGLHQRDLVTKTYVFRPEYGYWYLDTVLRETYAMYYNPLSTVKVQSTLLTKKNFKRKKFR